MKPLLLYYTHSLFFPLRLNITQPKRYRLTVTTSPLSLCGNSSGLLSLSKEFFFLVRMIKLHPFGVQKISRSRGMDVSSDATEETSCSIDYLPLTSIAILIARQAES